MNLKMTSSLRSVRYIFKFTNGLQAQKYSQYPSYYVHPIYRDLDQKNAIESGEAQKLSFVPIRAALSNQNASVFHDPLLNKVTNRVMEMGQKLLARTLMENTFQTIKRIQLEKIMKTTDAEAKAKIIANPYALLNLAVENGRPFLETTPIKRGGHTYQVPVPLSENRSYFLSIKWLIEAGNEKESEVKFATKFAYEIIEASNNQGKVIKRKQDLHKLCEANRAYAHYRWS